MELERHLDMGSPVPWRRPDDEDGSGAKLFSGIMTEAN
jgi:hypothetical protein